MEDLDARRQRRIEPRNPAALETHFRHLLSTDPATSYVAQDRGRVVAFGIVAVRGQDGFLSFLFVAPEWQGRGLGRAVLDACIRSGTGIERLSTCAEADQPVSTGLYASLGLAPRLPIYLLRGALGQTSLPVLPDGVSARPIAAEAVADVDAALMGYERPQDHAMWTDNDRRGWRFEGRDGDVLGYGYAHPSGRLGPVAARDPAQLPGFLGHLVRSTQVIEGWQVVVPGPAIEALRPLLAAGLRIDGTPAVYCAEGSGPAFDRYLPMSFALL